MSEFKEEIRLLALSLEVGETDNKQECPACGVGRGKFSLTRTAEGVLYNCYRASCIGGGFVPSAGYLLQARPRNVPPKDLTYKGEFRALSIAQVVWIGDRFGITQPKAFMGQTETAQPIFPLRDPLGRARGFQVRCVPWAGWPGWAGKAGGPKVLSYLERPQDPILHWTPPVTSPVIVLTEDIMSAHKVYETTGLRAAALLGVTLDIPKVREIAMQHPDQVLLALDNDATEQAFMLARTFGLAFKKMRIVLLTTDLKDVAREDVRDILGV